MLAKTSDLKRMLRKLDQRGELSIILATNEEGEEYYELVDKYSTLDSIPDSVLIKDITQLRRGVSK